MPLTLGELKWQRSFVTDASHASFTAGDGKTQWRVLWTASGSFYFDHFHKKYGWEVEVMGLNAFDAAAKLYELTCEVTDNAKEYVRNP